MKTNKRDLGPYFDTFFKWRERERERHSRGRKTERNRLRKRGHRVRERMIKRKERWRK